MPTQKPNKTREAIDKIFKDPDVAYGLKEFENIDFEEVLKITEKEKGKFYIKDFSGGNDRAIWNEEKQKGAPEEIVRQLWLYKINKEYKYPFDRIVIEKSVQFGREIHAKAADIIIYKKDKITPFIIFEVKSPLEKKGVEQLKGYLNTEGCEIGVWTNGTERVILYRSYPKEFEDSLSDIPRADQTIDDLFEVKKIWPDLNPKFDFIHIIKRIEELALAGSGANVFDEIFKIIYAKLYDEKLAMEKREDKEVLFRKYRDPERTFEVINDQLFKNAIKEWPDTFEPSDRIRLSPDRLSVCVPFLENVRLFEIGQGELEIIDSAFEYLITEVSKGKKGQYFTPRHVIKMCVKMMNPKDDEYIIDPACGSGGFLLHTMYKVWDDLKTEAAKKSYASKYLFGIDFDDNMRRISQALMLVAGDGRHHIFKRDSLDARDWQRTESEEARVALKPLLAKLENTVDEKENQKTYRYLDFDILLTNPPFAGENPEQGLLRQYDLAKKDGGKLKNNVERHILFIERSLDMLKSGGRMAIVLPQGVLNNTNMEYVRDFLFGKARILAVIGLHGNSFKPHTGTKTSVLFLQKWDEKEEIPNDYPIFMAVSKKGGKDNSGRYIYKKDTHDARGRKVLDHDLDQIADEFIKFAKEQKFSFVE
ncbi:restriction endonuclease subunit M [Patescibacteria group bacterium]